MGSQRDKESNSNPLSEREKYLLSTYGRLPRGGLLGEQSKKRAYFDSGDFALSAANRVTDNGAVQTGTAHPARESISRPFAPVPDRSNVDKAANESLHDKSGPEPGIANGSQARGTGFEDINIEKSKEQNTSSGGF